jgi:hypothetical protein
MGKILLITAALLSFIAIVYVVLNRIVSIIEDIEWR